MTRNDHHQTSHPFHPVHEKQNPLRRRRSSKTGEHPRLLRNLGWLSLVLGITALAAPRTLSKWIGVRNDHDALVRMIGVRELAGGIGILTQRNSSPWVQSRVAGDIMDLALMGTAFSSDTADRRRILTTSAAIAGLTLVDIHCARKTGRNGSHAKEHVTAITVNRPPEETYRFWRDFTNLPRFMQHLDSVQVTDAKRSHWVARGPAGVRVEWNAEMIADLPNNLIAWRSLENADVHHAGEVRFKAAPGGRGTEVYVRMSYDPPGGSLGVGVARLLGEEPGQQIKGDLYRFKQVMETGEVLHSDSSIRRWHHPARPAK